MKKAITRLLFLTVLCVGSIAGIAQEKRTVSGIVQDSANALSGVSVTVKGTKTSAIRMLAVDLPLQHHLMMCWFLIL